MSLKTFGMIAFLIAYVSGLAYFLIAVPAYLASQDQQLFLALFICYNIIPLCMKAAQIVRAKREAKEAK